MRFLTRMQQILRTITNMMSSVLTGKLRQVTDIQNPEYSLQFTSKFIENSSFLRLRNLRVGYNFNKEILEGTGLKRRVYF